MFLHSKYYGWKSAHKQWQKTRTTQILLAFLKLMLIRQITSVYLADNISSVQFHLCFLSSYSYWTPKIDFGALSLQGQPFSSS